MARPPVDFDARGAPKPVCGRGRAEGRMPSVADRACRAATSAGGSTVGACRDM